MTPKLRRRAHGAEGKTAVPAVGDDRRDACFPLWAVAVRHAFVPIRSVAAALLVGTAGMGPLSAADLVPFPIPAKANPRSLIAFPPSSAIAPAGPRLVQRDGHFYAGDQRVRLWGVNLCYGAALPTHRNADRIAERLAAAGINSVRLHGLDNDWSGSPGSLWEDKARTRFSDDALERLDYFVDQLARRGIYVYLNLLVNHSHARTLHLPEADKFEGSDQTVNLFVPELIEAQKAYARSLLTRENRYRKVRYADDPAIAFVEISNEHSFFFWGGELALRALPSRYAALLQAKYVVWLKARYRTDADLRKAWGAGTLAPVGEMIRNGDFRQRGPYGNGRRAWHLDPKPGCAARFGEAADGVRVELPETDGTNWHIQLGQNGLRLEKGRPYVLTFRARADQPRHLTFHVAQSREPWKELGFSDTVDLAAVWRRQAKHFVANADETDAALLFDLGEARNAVEIADVSLRAGNTAGLATSESLEAGAIALLGGAETEERAADRLLFLADTEKAFYDGMRAFLRNDLGCKALVTGTTAYGPLGVYAQSDMDFIDAHEYWSHPGFPDQPWDRENWDILQRAMTDYPAEATLWPIAARHLRGKPLTVSEYNHAAPNDAQAETVPLIASFAAAQNLDGVWLFDYSSRGDGAPQETFTDWFDIEGNPAKWGFMPAGAAIFRQGGIGVFSRGYQASLSTPEFLAVLHARYSQDFYAVLCTYDALAQKKPTEWTFLLSNALLVDWRVRDINDRTDYWNAAPFPYGAKLEWTVDPAGHGDFTAAGPGALVRVGHPTALPAPAAQISLQAPGFAAITVTALDGQPLKTSRKVLITACGRCENRGMTFNAARTSVGKDWGKAPVRIEPVTARILLPPGAWKCQALAADGTARTTVKPEADGSLLLLPEYGTMWYLLTLVPGET